MKADETNLAELLEGRKQYLVPLYQRTYSWENKNLKQLWDDLQLLVERRQDNNRASHFLGPMVFAPTPDAGPTGLKQYTIVDGQQRLLTLTLLLAAIRDHRSANEDSSHRDRLNEGYLIEKWSQGKPTKLIPTQDDRDSYFACLNSTTNAGAADLVGAAYNFFRTRLIEADDPNDLHDIQMIEEAVLTGFAIVTITSEPGDNVHRIFESLNNTGLKLTQADLLRNYIFMRLATRGEYVYRDIWFPLQQMLTSEELELLFWIDLTQNQPTAQQTEVYQLQQQRLELFTTEEEIEEEVKRFAAMGSLLHKARNPDAEKDEAVRKQLKRLRSWGSITAYPVIVHLLQRRELGQSDNTQTAQALRYLLSFFIRRILIGQATKNMNRILLAAVPAIVGQNPIDVSLQKYFSTGRKAWASDGQLRDSVTTSNVYWSGKADQKKLLLQWIEETYGSNEPVLPEKLSIEHIAPQTITEEWRAEVSQSLASGEDLDIVYQRFLHTLGNLTLTGYNPHMSNRSFTDKKKWFRESGLKMNHEIAAKNHWTQNEVRDRGLQLIERIISEWPGPDESLSEVIDDVTNPLWIRLAQALLAIPAGGWTSYGDLAALLGTHQVPLGTRLANYQVPNGYRVLRSDGSISPEFRWNEEGRTENPIDKLKTEGVRFDEQEHADLNQKLTSEDLAHLLGLDTTEIVGEISSPELGNDADLSDRFLNQIVEKQDASTVAGILALLKSWTDLGGHLLWGTSEETSCFLMARLRGDALGSIWPIAIYPNGKAEVVFQHMSVRLPFSDIKLRKEFMQMLNQADGVALPEAKINLRPGFSLQVLSNPGALASIEAALEWFLKQCLSPQVD
jgi:alkylated DNA nucleotide flippase Atl1